MSKLNPIAPKACVPPMKGSSDESPGRSAFWGKRCISTLPPEKKRAVWDHLQATAPGTAELLQSDVIKAFQREFPGVQIWLDDALIQPALRPKP